MIRALFCFALFLLATWRSSAVEVEVIRLTADAALAEVWVNGQMRSSLSHAEDWTRADALVPDGTLRCLAVKASAGEGQIHAGFAGAVVLQNQDLWVVTDRTWKAFAGEPPLDSEGREWTHPDYDDRDWPWAWEAGPYGCGPWGTNEQGVIGEPARSRLDGALRLSAAPEGRAKPTGASWLLGGGAEQIWNAKWIWAAGEKPLKPATVVCFRKRFDRGEKVPPTQPSHPQVSRMQEDGFTLSWKPSFSAQGGVRYRVVWNGLPVATTTATTHRVEGVRITPAPQNYAYVQAVAADGTRSVPSRFVKVALEDVSPPGPVLHARIVRQDEKRIHLAWDPASDDVGVPRYWIQANEMFHVVPGHVTECTLQRRGERSEISVTIRAVDGAGNQGPAAKMIEDPGAVSRQLRSRSPVLPEPSEVLLRFAVIVSTDGRWEFLEAALDDAVAQACDFVLIKGQIVPQLSGKAADWERVASIVDQVHSAALPVIASPLATKDQWPVVRDGTSSWPIEDWGFWTAVGRYDRFEHHLGQSLHQTHTELDGAFRLATFTENPRSNPDFAWNLERAVHAAEADPTTRWFMTSGISCESYPEGIPGIMLDLHRPTVEFMRMLNGNRGHELDWLPGRNILGACPQRNRVGGWYLVDVEEERLVFNARRQRDDEVIEEGRETALYHYPSNRVGATRLRIPNSSGMLIAEPFYPESGPVWTQNRIVEAKPGVPVRIQLLGRSTRGAKLEYEVVRQPRFGQLSGEGDVRLYTPGPEWSGEDHFLYEASDGGSQPGNTAWVRILASEE